MNTEYTTLADNATLYDTNGFVASSGVAVAKHIESDGNVIYSVGHSSYPAHEITETATSLTHSNGWEVKWVA